MPAGDEIRSLARARWVMGSVIIVLLAGINVLSM
jgi:hypothetical protein